MTRCDYKSAIQVLTDAAVPIGTQKVEIEDALGRVLAKAVTASENVPSFDRSPYDGYAFRAEDTVGAAKGSGVTLNVIENIRAGQVAKRTVESNTAIRLMTGAMIPEGADAVCKYEETDFNDTEVTIKRQFRSQENIVRAGEDIKTGVELATAGTVIDAGLIGALASIGMTEIAVYRRPVAGIISTGDEVTDDAGDLLPGKIRNSNRYTMSAALRAIGYDTVYLGHVSDDVDAIADLADTGAGRCDVVISTGGVSAGDFDLVPDAMEHAGYEILVRHVGMKPGMACAYGVREGRLWLALSGNPASALTNLQCICYPALKKLAGYTEYDHKIIRFRLMQECKKAGAGTRFLRGRAEYVDGEVYLNTPPRQGNVVISSAKGCNAYGILTDMTAPVKKGTMIEGFFI